MRAVHDAHLGAAAALAGQAARTNNRYQVLFVRVLHYCAQFTLVLLFIANDAMSLHRNLHHFWSSASESSRDCISAVPRMCAAITPVPRLPGTCGTYLG